MASKDDADRIAALTAELTARLTEVLGADLVADPQIAELINARVQAMVAASQANGGAPSSDGGLSSLIGLGSDAAPDLGKVELPRRVDDFDEAVTADRVLAVGRLYYIYQHEKVGVFRAVLKLQELFEAGAVKLSTGQGAYSLYRFDRRGVLRYSMKDRLAAYRRIFGYTNAAPPAGSKPNHAFHNHLTGFMTQVSQFYRDKRVSEVVRSNASDPSFGSIASVRRKGLDLRSNVKSASYGHASVMSVEAAQLLKEAFTILGSDDIRALFGAEDGWDVVSEVMRRYMGVAHVPVSQRSRMARAGQDVLDYLASNAILNSTRAQFEASLQAIGDAAEEWLTSAEELGDIPRRVQLTKPATGPVREDGLMDLML